MSYDLEIRNDEYYTQTVKMHKVQTFIANIEGITPNSASSLTFRNPQLNLYMDIDLEFVDADGDLHQDRGEEVNCIRLHIPYAFMHNNKKVYFDIGVRIARYLGWHLYDAQEDVDLCV